MTIPRLTRTVALMSQFLTSRLQIPNVPGVRETAHGLRALSNMTRFNKSDAIEIASAIFENRFEFASQVAATRQQVYKLLHNLVSKHRKDLQTMKGQFVDGFLELSAKETDPRNLMIVFSILPVIMTEFEYSDTQTTALWDAVAKYFPITFRPKPNDPIGITADDLKLKLRSCISATSAFASQAFPFLIQKLDDQTIANVKKDVMRTMTACGQSYDPMTVSLWSFQVWEALKYEVLSATDDDLAEDALNTLSAIAFRLSFQLNMQTLEDAPLHRYISLILTDCNSYLREPEQRHAKQAGQILGKIAASSPLAFHLVVKGVLPPLLTVYQDIDALSKKRCLLEVTNGLLDARLLLQLSKDSSGIDGAFSEPGDDSIESGGLHHFRDNLLEVYTVALTSTVRQEQKFRQTAMLGLLKLCKIPTYLTKPEIGMIVRHMTDEVLETGESNEDVRKEAITSLQQISVLHVQEVADVAFPALLGTLPDVLSEADAGEEYLNTLGALGKMSAGADLFRTFSIRLLNKLDAVLNQGTSLKYGKIILTGLLFGVKQHEILKPVTIDAGQNEDQLGTSIAERLLMKVTTVSTLSDGPHSGAEYVGLRSVRPSGNVLYADDEMLDLVGKICMVVVRTMSVQQQQTWLVPNITKLCSNIGTQLASTPTDKWFSSSMSEPIWLLGMSKQESLRKHEADVMASHGSIAILSMYMLAGLRKEIGPPYDSAVVCLSSLICLVHNASLSSKARFALQNTAALLVNKHKASGSNSSGQGFQSPKDFVEDLVKELLAQEHEIAGDDLFRRLQVVFSFIMAANLAVDRSTTSLLQTILAALDNIKLGHTFATYFKELLAPSEILCTQNHATIRQLSKQRLFGTCVPTIVLSFKATGDPVIKANYLIALAGILKHTPNDIVLPQIETLIPLLLQSLELKSVGSDDSVKSASIECLGIAITQSSTSAEGHAKSIITILKKTWYNTRDVRAQSSPDLRAKALSCMTLIPGNLRDLITLPFKQQVLRDLEAGAVGDPKRKVRTEAVDCRRAWANLAEPLGDDD